MENVWDYPRPPRLEACSRRVRVEHGGVVVADTTSALRVLETSHPPAIYVPPADITPGSLRAASQHATYCEWKGMAQYFDVVVGERTAPAAAWAYPEPVAAFAALRDHVSFYPGRVDACYLDDELVSAQEGGFYGGWVTSDITGPFKGAPGTSGW